MNTFCKVVLCALATLGLAAAAPAQDVISTVAGGGPNNLPGVDANVNQPYEVAIDAQGNLYFAASAQNRVFKINPAGILTVVAGTGAAGYSGDGGAATKAQLYTPWGVAVDKANPANVYIGDFNNCLVRRVSGSSGTISTVAGLVVHPATGNPYTSCGYSGNGGAADAAQLYGVGGLAINPNNNDLYISEYYNGVVRKVAGGAATGTISLVAGSGGGAAGNNCGGAAPFGDGSAATAAYLCYPQAVTLDTSSSSVNLFISEYNRCDIRDVVGATGKIYQVAGSYTLHCGFTDNVKATSGQLNDPWQSHVSVSGGTTTVSVSDYANARVRQFTLTYSGNVPQPGTIVTIAGKGQGGYCGDNGPALSACMNPVGLAYDSSGNIYIGDFGADRVRKILKSSGYISTVAGWGANGGTQTSYSDPVGIHNVVGGTVSLYQPYTVLADPASNDVYVGGYSTYAEYVLDRSTGTISSFAGNGVAGFAGDGTAAGGAGTEFNQPTGMAKDSSGNVYISDSVNCAVRKVSASTGDITTIVGGSAGHLNGCGYAGDTGPATAAKLYYPEGLAIDAGNNLYISEYYNCDVRRVSASSGVITTVAGNHTCGYNGDNIPATSAELRNPEDVKVDAAGNLYIADTVNSRIRRVDATTHLITTVAGSASAGYTGDGSATANSLYQPQGISVDPNGNIFIADYYNNIVRWVDPSGQLLTFGGSAPGSAGGSYGFGGDGGPATKALFTYPAEISQDSSGNFYISDINNQRIRKISAFAGIGRSTDSLDFETQPVGTTSQFQALTLSAIGPTSITNISTSSGFSEIDDCVGVPITARQNCEVDVYFAPTSSGHKTGTLTISSNAFFPANGNTVSLSGTAAGLSLTGNLNFSTQLIHTTVSRTVTLVNSGGVVTVHSISLTSPSYYAITGGTCPIHGGALGSNSSCTITVSFDPTIIGFKKDTLVVSTTDPASPLLVAATGTGDSVKLSASSITFTPIVFGSNSTQNLTITNTGTSTLTISTKVTGSSAFQVLTSGNTCTVGVAAGKSCVLPVLFKPAAVGSLTASLTLTTNGDNNPTVSLSGTCNPAVTVSATSLAYGTVTHGTKVAKTLTINNVGPGSLTVKTAISGSGAAAYSVLSTGNTCTSAVASGKSCSLPVQFAPAAAQAYSGTLTLTTNGGANPAVALSGTGK